MGLAEKRVAEEIKQKWASEWQKQIQDAIQAPIEIEVKFDTIVKDGQAGYALDAFNKVFVESTQKSFQELCKDALGKDAVAAALKKIVIQNVEGRSSGSRWATFADGTLTLDHSLSNLDYVKDRTDGLVAVLSNAL